MSGQQIQAHADMQTAWLWNMFFPERMTEEMAKEVKDDIIVHLQNILDYSMPYTKNLSMTEYLMDLNTLDEFQAHVRQKLNELPDSVQTVSGMLNWRDTLEGEWERLKNSLPYYGVSLHNPVNDTQELFDMKKQIKLHMSAILRNVKKIVQFLQSVHEPVQFLQSVHEPTVNSNKLSYGIQGGADMETAGSGFWNKVFGTTDPPQEGMERFSEYQTLVDSLQQILDYSILPKGDKGEPYKPLEDFKSDVRLRLQELPNAVKTQKGLLKWRKTLAANWYILRDEKSEEKWYSKEEILDMKKKLKEVPYMQWCFYITNRLLKILKWLHNPNAVDDNGNLLFTPNQYFVQCPLPISCV